MKIKILDTILDSYQAREIAKDYGVDSEQQGAEIYFNEIYYEGEWHNEDLPKYNKFIKRIEGGDLYYDYGADYYFLVKSQNIRENKNTKNMKRNTIRLTESDLHRVIKESVKNILREERFKKIKPHSEEYYNSPLYDPEYEDFDDWEKDADKYDTFYSYDEELPARVKSNPNQGYCEYSHTPTRKSFNQYSETRPRNIDARERARDNARSFDELDGNNFRGIDNDDIYRNIGNPNVADNNSRYFDNKTQNDIRKQLYDLEKDRRQKAIKQRREFKKDVGVADKRPLHRKGSLNRDIK